MHDQKDRIYKDIAKHAKAECIDDACRKIGTLLQNRNELLKVMRYLVDVYIEQFWDRSIQVSQDILHTIDIINTLNKRRLMHNPEFQEAMVQLVYLCLLHKDHFYDSHKFSRQHIDTSRLSNKLEKVFMCRESYGECKIVSKLFRGKMTIETSQLFDLLYHFMRHNDKKMSLYLVLYIIQWKDVSFDRVPTSHELFDDLKEEFTSDLVWYIWWFFFTYVDSMKVRDDRHAMHWYYVSKLIDNNFRLYKCLYMKKNRETRVCLLQNILIAILSTKMVDIDSSCFFQKKPEQSTIIHSCLFSNHAPVISSIPQIEPEQNIKKKDNDIKKKDNDFNFLNCIIYNELISPE